MDTGSERKPTAKICVAISSVLNSLHALWMAVVLVVSSLAPEAAIHSRAS